MQKTCILSIVILTCVLIAGCQRSKDDVSVSPKQPTEPQKLETDTADSISATGPKTQGSAKAKQPIVSEPKKTPAAEDARKPAKPAVAPEPDPSEAGGPTKLPVPPKLQAIDQSEFGPDPAMQFASNAFPPTLSDTEWHRGGWDLNACLRCHETGVGKAPRVFHKNMPVVLLKAKCRSCHVLIPGDSVDAVVVKHENDAFFDDHAFPPMLPNSKAHVDTWRTDNCMRCHEDGLKDAPVTKHASQHMPRLLLKAKCRTCHVQVRAIESAVE